MLVGFIRTTELFHWKGFEKKLSWGKYLNFGSYVPVFCLISRAGPSIYKKFDQDRKALKNFRPTLFVRGEKKCKSKEVEGTHSKCARGKINRDRERKIKK